jgi:hypothetical protein
MIKLSIHTEKRVIERGIARAWIDATVLTSDWTAADADPALTRSYRAIAEFGGRVLRVVHRPDGSDILVVTALFDRSAKR